MEQFPNSERVVAEEGNGDTLQPIAEKVREYPESKLPEVDSFPEADSVKFERLFGSKDTMYADDASTAVR